MLKGSQPRNSQDPRGNGRQAAGPQAGDGQIVALKEDPKSALGAIGMQDEMIRARISQMLERLDDVASLKSEFETLVDPLASFAAEYPQLKAKLLDTEAMLVREREGNASLAQQIRHANAEKAKLQDQIASLGSQNQELRELAKAQEAAVGALRRDLREKEIVAANLERQVKAEAERADALAEETAALREEVVSYEANAARLERDLTEARQSAEMLEHDNRTLRNGSAEQTNRLAAVESAHGDLERELEAARQQITELEAKLKAEQSLRHRLEALGESERATARTNAANLELKMQGLTSRLAVTEKLLGSTRDQLREKSEEFKSAERTAREALVQKNSYERRLESLQAEVARLSAASEEAHRNGTDLADRCETLSKELEAKDAAIAKAEHRTQMLLDRIDQLTREFDSERQALDARNAALTEELQREKSERAIAQGALEMARRSRVEIHREFLKIKKLRPGVPEAEDEGEGESEGAVKRDTL
ncbi:MAG TPA: hypothetical protein VF601_18285 [Beijerinckiaceae bacterium]|jgi:crescentin